MVKIFILNTIFELNIYHKDRTLKKLTILLAGLSLFGYCTSDISITNHKCDTSKTEKEYCKSKLLEIADLYPDTGNITKVINVYAPKLGHYDFIFTEKIIKQEKFGGNYSDVYGIKKDGKYGVVRKEYNEPYVLTQKNLHAYVLLQDHGGYLKKAVFKDFGNEVYWPEFQYKYCLVDDADKNGIPEFYVSYFGASDGLDAKPFKVITYTYDDHNTMFKSKATALYPAGNEEDVYTIEYDTNSNLLPKAIRKKIKWILDDHKKTFKE